MLRDKPVCSINDSRIQRCLLSEADLDFDKALKTSLAMKMADRDAEDLQGHKKATTTEGAVFRAGVGEPRKSRLSKLLQVWWETQGVAMQTQGDCLSSLWEEGAHP